MIKLAAPKQIFTYSAYGLAVAYLAFHALHGEQGIYALVKELHRKEMLGGQLSRATAERQTLQHRAKLLRDQSIDPDLLDEEARRALGMAGADEVILLRPVPSPE